ncbi:hypothetical protein GCM10017776_16110 [Streptomyces griseoluteus]|nr:hypothetical protein GCM10017776_16110 [Streptomyces griseoluteus]
MPSSAVTSTSGRSPSSACLRRTVSTALTLGFLPSGAPPGAVVTSAGQAVVHSGPNRFQPTSSDPGSGKPVIAPFMSPPLR